MISDSGDKITSDTDNSARYTISELSHEFNVSARTIRFYEDKQLLHPDRSQKNRSFSNADRTQLRLVLRGKRLGFSLQEIAEILNLYRPCNNREQLTFLLQKIDNRKKILRQQQQDINTLLSDLSLLEQQCIGDLDIERTDKKTRLAMGQIWAKDKTEKQDYRQSPSDKYRPL